MNETLTSLSCASFVRALSAKQPVPGGGAAAALSGALASALCSMVGNYTTGKKRYAAYEDDVQRMIAEAGELSQEFLELVEKDAAAYSLVSAAYGLEKDDPSRAAVIEEALLAAARPPFHMMATCAKTLPLLEEMAEKGSVMLVSDVGCAAELLGAAARAARMNVLVNTASMTNKVQADALESQADELLADLDPRVCALSAAVVARIRKEA